MVPVIRSKEFPDMIYLVIPSEIAGFPYKKSTNIYISGLGREEGGIGIYCDRSKSPVGISHGFSSGDKNAMK